MSGNALSLFIDMGLAVAEVNTMFFLRFALLTCAIYVAITLILELATFAVTFGRVACSSAFRCASTVPFLSLCG